MCTYSCTKYVTWNQSLETIEMRVVSPGCLQGQPLLKAACKQHAIACSIQSPLAQWDKSLEQVKLTGALRIFLHTSYRAQYRAESGMFQGLS
eukprot:SAG25_NODE_108_length_15257_cov_63.784404_4_plen_92_part_00